MKKFLAILMAALMLVSMAALASCGDNTGDDVVDPGTDPVVETVKIGLGFDVDVKASDATEEKNGQGQATATIAAVLVDANGKIVKCVIDCADNKVDYTAAGQAVANDSFKTKYELGDAYGMKAYGGSALEWFEQADAFEALVIGKTADEVKALVAADAKGTEDVINAGCTITIDAFADAVVKAVANAVDSAAVAANELKLGVYTVQSTSDATEEKNGKNQVETTVFAAAVGEDGKITAAASDCLQVGFTFDAAGVSTFDATKEVLTKKELGDNYGMKAYGGAALEWFEQAAAFDAACIGKTAAEVAGLMGEDNYGTADLKAAGCTIIVDAFVKAAAKIG